MKLCSVTLHPRTDDMAPDALRSVLPFVDACLILDTHPEPGYPFALEREVCGEKLQVVRYRELTWDDDSAAVRRHSLQVAADLGFDWACILDTDERIHVPAECDVRHLLEETDADVIGTPTTALDYLKARLFRLPARGEWYLPAHEFFRCSGVYQAALGIRFSEIPKVGADIPAKLRGVIRALSRYVQETPDAPEQARAWEYLGHSHRELAEHEAAIRCYEQALKKGASGESSGWIHYCIAMSAIELGDYNLARWASCFGLINSPWMAELQFVGAIADIEAGRYGDAAARANMAVSLGCFCGGAVGLERSGFRNNNALWEGSFIVLEEALRGLGNTAEAARVAEVVIKAMRAREAQGIAGIDYSHENDT